MVDPSKCDRLELKIPPPLVALLVGVAMWVVAGRLTPIQFAGPRGLMIAAACVLFGIIVAGAGVLAFRHAKTTLNPVTPGAASSVVVGGIFRYTRNPMYVGLTAVLVGWAIWLSVPWTLLGPIAFALYMTRFQILPEERVMSAKFGRDYDEYRERVRRWL